MAIGDWLDQMLNQAEALADAWQHGDAVRSLRTKITGDWRTFEVRFGLTHADLIFVDPTSSTTGLRWASWILTAGTSHN